MIRSALAVIVRYLTFASAAGAVAVSAQAPSTDWVRDGIAGDIHGVATFGGRNFSGQKFLHHCNALCNQTHFGPGFRAASVRIESGLWKFCSDVNLQGECSILGQGDYPDTSLHFPAALFARLGSMQRISDQPGVAPRPVTPPPGMTTKH